MSGKNKIRVSYINIEWETQKTFLFKLSTSKINSKETNAFLCIVCGGSLLQADLGTNICATTFQLLLLTPVASSTLYFLICKIPLQLV